jgi:hypothetical protein
MKLFPPVLAALALAWAFATQAAPTTGTYQLPGVSTLYSAEGIEQIGLDSSTGLRCAVGEPSTGTCQIPIAGTISAAGLATSANQATINTTLGSPFQAGGSIGNTGFASTQSGAWSLSAATTGGANTKSIQAANNTTSIAVCSAACTLYGVYVQNNSATIAYLKLYNVAQGSQTCGSGTPADRIMIPANASGAGAVIPIAGGLGAAYSTALSVCITTGIGDSDTTAPAASAYQVSLYTK